MSFVFQGLYIPILYLLGMWIKCGNFVKFARIENFVIAEEERTHLAMKPLVTVVTEI